MKFLITPNKDLTSQAILTDDYSPSEVADNLHIKHIRADIKELKMETPVRIYAIVDDKPPKTYLLLS